MAFFKLGKSTTTLAAILLTIFCFTEAKLRDGGNDHIKELSLDKVRVLKKERELLVPNTSNLRGGNPRHGSRDSFSFSVEDEDEGEAVTEDPPITPPVEEEYEEGDSPDDDDSDWGSVAEWE